jgi:hypothetical protein
LCDVTVGELGDGHLESSHLWEWKRTGDVFVVYEIVGLGSIRDWSWEVG